MKTILIKLLFIIFPALLFGQNAQIIYKNTVNSTVTIETEVGQGSGFFIDKNIVVTNYHVIEGSIEAYCYTQNSSNKFKVQGFLAVDKSNDLVLLKVSDLNRPPLKFASTSVSAGQNVFVIGSPKGLPATISDGIVSGLRNFNFTELIQITAPISPGSSGGPVLNSQGQLVGVSVSQLKEGQNINFAIPAKYLKKLLGEISPVKELMYLDEGLLAAMNATYTSVDVGTRTWMLLNLNVDRFRNGEIIPEAKSIDDWERAGKDGKPAWCYYNNDPKNGDRVGKLYNWYAIIDPRGLAPRGWHIATLEDWKDLIEASGEGRDNLGEYIKSSTGWKDRNGNNQSGFSAYPSGYRLSPSPKFFSLENAAFWWLTDESSNDPELGAGLLLSGNSQQLLAKQAGKAWGLSVRCVKD